jgi:hypothetical protein
MKDLETFVVHLLLSESLNVFFNENEISLVSLNRVAQVVLIDLFLMVS